MLGMDALVHALEALFVPMYHPLCDGAALQAMRLIQVHLEEAVTKQKKIIQICFYCMQFS